MKQVPRAIAHARQRLTAILEYHITNITEMANLSHKAVVFNQSLLEQWLDILQKILFLKQKQDISVKPLQVLTKGKDKSINAVRPSRPFSSSQQQQKHILNIEANVIEIWPLDQTKEDKRKLTFAKGLIRKYNSCTFIGNTSYVIIGGCRESKPNLKSPDILHFDIRSQQLTKIAQLDHGISSHCTVRLDSSLFVIGGNRDHNMVTRNCFRFDLKEKQVKPIAKLNYPAASHCAIAWKNEYVYKFGGLGSCFGDWDLSPYIERYSLSRDEWQIINPSLQMDELFITPVSLLVNSLAYASKESIVILGGFDINQKGSNQVLQILIQEDNHSVIKAGEVEGLLPGGFASHEPVHTQKGLIALQTVDIGKEIANQPRLVRITDCISYI